MSEYGVPDNWTEEELQHAANKVEAKTTPFIYPDTEGLRAVIEPTMQPRKDATTKHGRKYLGAQGWQFELDFIDYHCPDEYKPDRVFSVECPDCVGGYRRNEYAPLPWLKAELCNRCTSGEIKYRVDSLELKQVAGLAEPIWKASTFEYLKFAQAFPKSRIDEWLILASISEAVE